jgi:hypothetical protein
MCLYMEERRLLGAWSRGWKEGVWRCWEGEGVGKGTVGRCVYIWNGINSFVNLIGISSSALHAGPSK